MSKEIHKLTSGITHEINTPLTYIKGNFEMMKYDIDSLPQTDIKTRLLEDALKITEGLQRIENIIDAMREVSSTSSEEKADVDLYCTLVRALTLSYSRSKHISKIYLRDQLFNLDINKNCDDCEKYNVHIQRQRLEQVWIIIITNALDELIKKDDYDSRFIKISLYKENNEVIVKFKDNAGGIDATIIDDIFEPFVSAKEHCGIGVGLNIANKIILEHNGTLNAYNEDDGAVFEIRLKIEEIKI